MPDTLEIIIDDVDIAGDTVARVTAKANAVLIPDYARNFPTTIPVDEISFRVAADLFGPYIWTTAPTITDNRVGTGHFPQGPKTTALWHVLAAPLVEEITGNNPVSASGSLVEDADGIAWDMDGVTHEVDWGTTQDYLTGVLGDVTIRALLKTDNAGANKNAFTKGQNQHTGADDSFGIGHGGSSKWRFRMMNSLASTTLGSVASLGTLVEIAAVYESGVGQRIFTDGVQDATQDIGTGNFHNTAVYPLMFGAANYINNGDVQLYAAVIDTDIRPGFEAE